jgi:xanthine/CO dehydrogenase XdhC/CoxF family maturation factor
MEDPSTNGSAWVDVVAVALRGDPPCKVGNRLRVSDSGIVSGTLGCAEFDARAIADASSVLADGSPQTRTYSHELGEVDVFLEPRTHAGHLVAVSATPVSLEVMKIARSLGYSITLVEARTERISPEHRTVADDIGASFDGIDLGAATDVVFTDHEMPSLVEFLAAALNAPVRSIGLMGSRRHTGAHIDGLRSEGFDERTIARIRTPVGLDIGANSPAEIAVSIVAGLIASANGRRGGWLDTRVGERSAPGNDPGNGQGREASSEP